MSADHFRDPREDLRRGSRSPEFVADDGLFGASDRRADFGTGEPGRFTGSTKGMLNQHVAEDDLDRQQELEEQIAQTFEKADALLDKRLRNRFSNDQLQALMATEQSVDHRMIDFSKRSRDDDALVLQSHYVQLEELAKRVIADSSNFMKQDARNALSQGEGQEVYSVTEDLSSDFLRRASEQVVSYRTKSLEVRNVVKSHMLIGCVACGLLATVIGFALSRSIVRPLARSVKLAQTIAGGDLTQHLDDSRRDEIGDLARAMNQMTANLAEIIGQMSSASAEMEAASKEQAVGATNQSTATTEMSTTASELLTNAQQVAKSGTSVSEQASTAAEECAGGVKSVQDTVQGITGIRDRVETIAEHMVDLGGKSQQISGVLEIINELAEQTNLLSFNASIEAAGAGEAGKRFAVVASEIRKLAERAGESTTEIRRLIDSIQQTVNATIMATEEGTKAVQMGVRLTKGTKSTFGRIASQVASTRESAKAIEMASRQQATALEQLDSAVRNIDTTAQQANTASRQVQSEAQGLAEAARRFKTRRL